MIYIPYTVNIPPHTEYLKCTTTAHAQMCVTSAMGEEMLVISEVNNVSNATCYSARARDQQVASPAALQGTSTIFPIVNLTITFQFEIYRGKL
jgi:hypothetical protein